jgi:hypothetical protein
MVSLATLQDSFVKYLPHLRRIARYAFRHLQPERRAEAVSNTIALCWKAWARLGELDKADSPGILKAIVWYSVKQTKAGRRIDWAGKPRDVLSLRSYGKVRFDPWNLEDYVGKETPIPDAVSFRLDVPAFLAECLTERQRSLAVDLAQGMSTTEAATKYNRSPGAISQFRRRFKVLFDQYFDQ